MSELLAISAVLQVLRARWQEAAANERGEAMEKVIITAIFAALALAVGAIIVAKVTAKAESIPTK